MDCGEILSCILDENKATWTLPVLKFGLWILNEFLSTDLGQSCQYFGVLLQCFSFEKKYNSIFTLHVV